MSSFLPLIFQLVGAYFGGPVGAILGALIGVALFGSASGKSEGPRLNDLKVQSSAFGAPIPITWGSVRLSGNIIWSPGIREAQSRKKQGGGLLGGGATIITYKYYFSGAIAICEGEISTVRRIWANNKLIYGSKTSDPPTEEDYEASIPIGFELEIFTGSEDQLPPNYMLENGETYETARAAVPAYRGTAYVLIKNFDLEQYGNQVPHFEFEVIRGPNHQKPYQELTVVDRTYEGFGGWEPNEGIWWITPEMSVLYGYDAWTMTLKYEFSFLAFAGGGGEPFLNRMADGKWALIHNVGAGFTLPHPHVRFSVTDSPKDGFYPAVDKIHWSNFYHPGPTTITYDNGYGAMRLNWNNNGVSGGQIRSEFPPLQWPFGWPNTWSYYGAAPDWALHAYADPGGQSAFRVGEELGNYQYTSTAAWSFIWGYDRWYVLESLGMPWTSLGSASATATNPPKLGYGARLPSNPSLAHDPTRDRLWIMYWRPEGTIGDGQNINVDCWFLGYMDLSKGVDSGWQRVDIPELDQFEHQFGWNVALAYNKDYDYLLLAGRPITGDNFKVIAVTPDSSFIEAAELLRPTELKVNLSWDIYGAWDGPGSIGYDTLSRRNWMVMWEANNNTLLKIWWGLPYTDTKVPLWQIVQDICLRCGLEESDIDVSELTDLVQGYAVARPMTARAAIEPLLPAYFFDAVESGEDS